MKMNFISWILLLFTIFLLLVCINTSNTKKEIKTVREQNVISAKYEDGVIVVELEDEGESFTSIEKYDISLVTIKAIAEEKSYIKKHFNGYGKLKEVILFYNGEIL